MSEQNIETIEFDNLKVTINRQPTHELYIALRPPDAEPYIVAPKDKKPEEIVAFVEHWVEIIRELRTDMLKRFDKSKSLKCRYQTGDVAYLLGRPFMLRAFPLASGKSRTKNVRGRAKVKATFRPEISVIDLFLVKPGDFDQGRLAFMSFATPILARNAQSLIHQCMARVFPDEHIPTIIKTRPMHDKWIRIDKERDTVWFSESLVPYPGECIVYLYLSEIIKVLRPEASEEDRQALFELGLPDWKKWSTILADQSSPYTNQ